MINVQYPFLDLTHTLIALSYELKPNDWNKKTLLRNCRIDTLVNYLIDIHLAVLNGFEIDFALDENADAQLNLINEKVITLADKIKSQVNLVYVDENRYCNCWLMQQYIWQALNNQQLLQKTFYFPFLNRVLQKLANHYQPINATNGTTLTVEIVGEAGGIWTIKKRPTGWENIEPVQDADVTIYLDQQLAWLLFDGALHLHEIGQYYQIIGNKELGNHFLNLRN